MPPSPVFVFSALLPTARTSFLGLKKKSRKTKSSQTLIVTPVTEGEYEHTLSGKLVCLCACEDRGASPTLTAFVNFQIFSTIIPDSPPSESINSWLITRWSYQQLVDKSKSLHDGLINSWLISQNPINNP